MVFHKKRKSTTLLGRFVNFPSVCKCDRSSGSIFTTVAEVVSVVIECFHKSGSD